MAFLDALTEEGLEAEATYAMPPDAIKKMRGMKGGIIAVINPKGFFTPRGKNRIRTNLLKGGFFSRNILITYDMGSAVLASQTRTNFWSLKPKPDERTMMLFRA